MKAGSLVIRILAILLQFGALSADDSTQYAGCQKNVTSSSGSVSEGDFSGLSCPEHEIRIQAGVPIVLTCQDLVLQVGSQQYCVSIGEIKIGKKNKVDKPNGFRKHRMYNLDNKDSNNGGKRTHDRKPHMKSSVNSYAEDGGAPWKKNSKRGGAGRSNDSGNDPAKATERMKKKLQKMEAKLGQTKALGKERMAQRLNMEIARTKGRLEDLKSNYHQKMAKQKLSTVGVDNTNKKNLEKLTLRLQKQQEGIAKIEKKITKLQGKPNNTKQLAKLQKKVNKFNSKSAELQNKIDELQSLLGTTVGHTDDTNGSGYTDDVRDNTHYDVNNPDNSDDVSGDGSPDGDSDNDDMNGTDNSDDVSGDGSPDGDSDNHDMNGTDNSDDVSGDGSPDGDSDNHDMNGTGNSDAVSDDNHDDVNNPDNSDDVSGDGSPDGDSDNNDKNDPGHLDDVSGDVSPDGDGDGDNWPRTGNWPRPMNEGAGKPKGQRWGKESERNSGKMGKGERMGTGKEQSFCGPLDQPITINSQTGEIDLSVRPKGPKTGSGRKPSKPHHGVVTQDPAGAAVVMIPSEVKYTCSWSPASP